jgi:DNA-directed RNA polymerase II subunit RPB2
MLRSTYCILKDSNDKELTDLGECPYDQGGYFVINGSEKVLIAQEKMTNNAVYVFSKKQPSKYSWVAEIKSSIDASRPASAMHVRLLNVGQVGTASLPCPLSPRPLWAASARADLSAVS